MKAVRRGAGALGLAMGLAMAPEAAWARAQAPASEAAGMRAKIEGIVEGVHELHQGRADYKNLSNKALLRGLGAARASAEGFVTPWGAPIAVRPASLWTRDDAFAIEYRAEGGPADQACAFLKSVEIYFRQISLGGRVLKSDGKAANWNCEGVKPGAVARLTGS